MGRHGQYLELTMVIYEKLKQTKPASFPSLPGLAIVSIFAM
jgi:hypothetical protein